MREQLDLLPGLLTAHLELALAALAIDEVPHHHPERPALSAAKAVVTQ